MIFMPTKGVTINSSYMNAVTNDLHAEIQVHDLSFATIMRFNKINGINTQSISERSGKRVTEQQNKKYRYTENKNLLPL